MIVTTGRIIKVDAGNLHFERTCETPGAVTLRDLRGVAITLPANPEEVERVIAAYRRAAAEDIAYRESKHESAPRPVTTAPGCNNPGWCGVACGCG